MSGKGEALFSMMLIIYLDSNSKKVKNKNKTKTNKNPHLKKKQLVKGSFYAPGSCQTHSYPSASSSQILRL